VLGSQRQQLASEQRFIDAAAIGRPPVDRCPGALLSGYSAASNPAFFCAKVSFSTPEPSDILCGTTGIRHDFS
jgi:hypothetical protein